MAHHTEYTNGFSKNEITEILKKHFDYKFANATTLDKDSVTVILPGAICELADKFQEMDELINRLYEDLEALEWD